MYKFGLTAIFVGIWTKKLEPLFLGQLVFHYIWIIVTFTKESYCTKEYNIVYMKNVVYLECLYFKSKMVIFYSELAKTKQEKCFQLSTNYNCGKISVVLLALFFLIVIINMSRLPIFIEGALKIFCI